MKRLSLCELTVLSTAQQDMFIRIVLGLSTAHQRYTHADQ